jgi:hypothetical protein
MTTPAASGLRKRAAGAHPGLWALAAVVLCLSLPAPDGAVQAQRERPTDEQPEQYPDGPSREETFYFCTACHGFKIVAAQGMSRSRWNDTLDFMVTRHNMPDVQGADRDRMLDYLESAFPERRQPGGWKNPFAPQ